VKAEILSLFEQVGAKGKPITHLQQALAGKSVAGKPITVTVDHRALPYLNHLLVGWVDGPAPSNVLAVLSGQDPRKEGCWRRFSLSHKGPWRVEIDVFPTPFHTADSPLSPGIPPSASGKGAH
jgi:hypothetical protein